MKSVPHLFADITAVLEGMHGVAVEGKAADFSPDMHSALLHDLRSGVANLHGLLTRIALLLLLGESER